MNRKDIALTVGGALASMVLAYVFYRHEQTAAQASVQASASAGNAGSAEDLANELAYYQIAGGSSSGSAAAVPSLASSTSSAAPATSTGSTSDGSIDPGTANLLSQIIAAYSPPANVNSANLLLSPINTDGSSALANVPTTVSQALAQVPTINNYIEPPIFSPPVFGTGQDYSGLAAPQSGASVSTHPVNLHPLAGAA